MIAFENEVHEDFKHGYMLVWAETPDGRVRCRASYSFIEDLLGLDGADEARVRAPEALEQLKPLFRKKINAREFAKCDMKTVTVS